MILQYQVGFKRVVRYFLADSVLNPGDHVRVEGDRGEDLGIIKSTTSISLFLEQRNFFCQDNSMDYNGTWTLKRILRLATVTEIEQLQAKIREENQVLQVMLFNILIFAHFDFKMHS